MAYGLWGINYGSFCHKHKVYDVYTNTYLPFIIIIYIILLYSNSYPGTGFQKKQKTGDFAPRRVLVQVSLLLSLL
jgi:hypothetical protein